MSQRWPVDSIKVGKRYRRKYGDIDALAASMVDLGLLQPIVVTQERKLVCGARRLKAAKQLGWTEIDVRVAGTLSEAARALRAEHAENVCRLDFAPTERSAIAAAVEEALRPLAEARMKAGTEPSAKFAEGRPRDIGAEAAGASHETIRKVRYVEAVSEDDSQPEAKREEARQALAEMDETGKVDGPYRRVREAADPIAEAKAAARTAPSHVADKAIEKFRLAVQAVEVAGGVDVIVADLDTAPLADGLAQEWARELDRAAEVIDTWRTALRRRNVRSVR